MAQRKKSKKSRKADPQAMPLTVIERRRSTQPDAGVVRVDQRTHPTVATIVSELTLVRGDLAMPEERFEFWARRLWVKHPREKNAQLYNQLGRLSFFLARYHCLGALQLFALATLGLRSGAADKHSSVDDFLRTPEAQQARNLATVMAASGVTPAFGRPPESGAKLRRRTGGGFSPLDTVPDRAPRKNGEGRSFSPMDTRPDVKIRTNEEDEGFSPPDTLPDVTTRTDRREK